MQLLGLNRNLLEICSHLTPKMQLLEALKYQKYIIKSIKSQDRVEELKVVKDHQVESPEDSIQLIKQ